MKTMTFLRVSTVLWLSVFAATFPLMTVASTIPLSDAAKAPVVKIKASAERADAGSTIEITGTVSSGAARQELALQRQEGTKWVDVEVKNLPDLGNPKKRKFEVKHPHSGKFVYRLSLARKGTTQAAKSPVVTVAIAPLLDFTFSSSTKSDVMEAKFSGKVKGLGDGQDVVIQRRKSDETWTRVGKAIVEETGNNKTYRLNSKITIKRGVGNNGAPKYTFRAVTTGNGPDAVSAVKAVLAYTRWDGVFFTKQMPDGKETEAGTAVVLYHEKWCRLSFSASGVQVIGTTDGWDLVDNSGFHISLQRYKNAGEKHNGSVLTEPIMLMEGTTTSGLRIKITLRPN